MARPRGSNTGRKGDSVSLYLAPETLKKIDAVRGKISRSKYVRQIIDAAHPN
jgi:hypothetical protein